MSTEKTYRAFISYSHADEKAAARLQRRLEAFKLPRHLVEINDGHQTLRPIFRDRSELASSTRLSDAVQTALSHAQALIVVCSPAAMRSKWVNEEVRYFRQHHPDRPILAFVVDGRPEADPRSDVDAAFPLALVLEDPNDLASDLFDPLAADARRQGDGFRMATLRLVAGLLGVGFDDLWRRQQKANQRWWVAISAVLLALTTLFAVLTWQAMVARKAAEQAEARAQLELTSEQQTRQFLLNIFSLSDAGVARGADITVREVLDRAVATIDAADFDKPVVRSRLLATMGQAYSSLGLNKASVEMLQQSIELLDGSEQGDLEQRISSRIELADVLYTMGDYEAALSALATARTDIDRSRVGLPHLLASLENVAGDIHVYSGNDAAARRAYQSVLDLSDALSPNDDASAAIQARALGGFALLAHFNGDAVSAVAYFSQSHRLSREAFGDLHPDTNWALVSMGAAAKSAGQYDLARESWQSAMEYARLMYDAGNPEIGTLQNNLGRLALEQGELARADNLLEQALASDRAHRADDFDGLVYTLNNLAEVRMGEGDFQAAEALLSEALPIAEESQHEMLGSVLVKLADIRCAQGDQAAGQALAERAVERLTSDYEQDDWRVVRAEITQSYCRGTQPSGDPVARLQAKWGEQNPFVKRAQQQLAQLP